MSEKTPIKDLDYNALGKALDLACAASAAKNGEHVRGSDTCPQCGGTFDFAASVPKRKRAFVQIRCRTQGCLSAIT